MLHGATAYASEKMRLYCIVGRVVSIYLQKTKIKQSTFKSQNTNSTECVKYVCCQILFIVCIHKRNRSSFCSIRCPSDPDCSKLFACLEKVHCGKTVATSFTMCPFIFWPSETFSRHCAALHPQTHSYCESRVRRVCAFIQFFQCDQIKKWLSIYTFPRKKTGSFLHLLKICFINGIRSSKCRTK